MATFWIGDAIRSDGRGQITTVTGSENTKLRTVVLVTRQKGVTVD